MENSQNEPREDQKANKNKKTSKICLIVGFVLLGIGAVLMILGLVVFREPFGSSTIPNTALLMIGFGICGSSLFAFMFGAVPYLAKLNAKLSKEALDYAGDDIAEAGKKAVDVAAPIADKAADVMSPAIAKTAKTIKDATKEDMKYCKHCGDVIDADSKFCKSCGKEQ